MNSAVLAAIIGVSGTVIVAVVGFWTAARNTGKTIAHARETRVWDRKADAYQDALTAALWRNNRRRYLTSPGLTDEQRTQETAELFAQQQDEDLWSLGARLGAFGAPEVNAAYIASMQGNDIAQRQFELWRKSQRRADEAREAGIPSAPFDQATGALMKVFVVAMESAADSDRRLERTIRTDLLKNLDGARPPSPGTP